MPTVIKRLLGVSWANALKSRPKAYQRICPSIIFCATLLQRDYLNHKTVCAHSEPHDEASGCYNGYCKYVGRHVSCIAVPRRSKREGIQYGRKDKKGELVKI